MIVNYIGYHINMLQRDVPKPFLSSPEKLLLIEVLHDAINQKDKEWVSREEDTHYFSFKNICAILDLPIDTVKKQLLHSFENKKPRLKMKIHSIANKKYSHPYVKQLHCRECKSRYHLSYDMNRKEELAN